MWVYPRQEIKEPFGELLLRCVRWEGVEQALECVEAVLDLGPRIRVLAVDPVGEAMVAFGGEGTVGDAAACAVVGDVARVKGDGWRVGRGCEDEQVEPGVARVRRDASLCVCVQRRRGRGGHERGDEVAPGGGEGGGVFGDVRPGRGAGGEDEMARARCP